MGICDFDPVLDFEPEDLEDEPGHEYWYDVCWGCVDDCDNCILGGL